MTWSLSRAPNLCRKHSGLKPVFTLHLRVEWAEVGQGEVRIEIFRFGIGLFFYFVYPSLKEDEMK